MNWSRILLRAPATATDEICDELCCELIELGALGTSCDTPGTIACFVASDDSLIATLREAANERGFAVEATEEVPQQNWTQQCSEVWAPLTIGKLRVIPVQSASDAPPAHGPFDLRIIPGLGFGTGHHPTTKMILSVLSDISSDPHYTSPSAIFDLGTGSGILAIAAAKLFAVPVIANDIDSHAVQNAQENSLLNRLESFITTTTTPTEAIAGQFELIIANVYGEVLIQLAPQVSRLSAPGATLILSGITELVCDSVIDAYTSSADTWRIEQELSEGGWVCLVLKRL